MSVTIAISNMKGGAGKQGRLLPIGDSVTVVIQRYDSAKKQIFGKIVAKE